MRLRSPTNIVRDYEDLVQNNVRLDEKKVIAYEDLEKLYRKIKKSPSKSTFTKISQKVGLPC